MIEEPTEFLKNLYYQMERKAHFLEENAKTFRDQVRKCMESFEEIYYREAYKEMLDEFIKLVKNQRK
ncbi:MAG: hypothetical protein EU543_04955 [Promethearchaeota archaeon]|nr:MAG: hypothetical protein EU543_04955 [Candidatus Lokiarchaeota archaeon]